MDKGGVTGAILTDLAKAFDCILHDLLIAKLTVYGFDYQSLRIKYNFLSNRHQRTKINNAFIHYSEVICRVRQGSILVPYLSISISVIYFLTSLNVMLQVMWTLIYHIILILILTM